MTGTDDAWIMMRQDGRLVAKLTSGGEVRLGDLEYTVKDAALVLWDGYAPLFFSRYEHAPVTLHLGLAVSRISPDPLSVVCRSSDGPGSVKSSSV